jgi:hypothetical protein
VNLPAPHATILYRSPSLAEPPSLTVSVSTEDEKCGELQLTSDDYLQGVIGMVNELPRLSINAVTAQNFALPGRIAAFVNDVFASYSMVRVLAAGIDGAGREPACNPWQAAGCF